MDAWEWHERVYDRTRRVRGERAGVAEGREGGRLVEKERHRERVARRMTSEHVLPLNTSNRTRELYKVGV